MNQSKIFLLIVILVAIGAAAFVINYTKQPFPITQPIKLPVKEKISVSEESEKLEEVKMVEIEKIKDEIKTEAEGEIIQYQEESFYSEDDFSVILENEDEFSSQLKEEFRSRISKYKKEIANLKVEFNLENNSAILTCDIAGAISKSGNKYSSEFEWLIYPLGLDFIDDNFKESDNQLAWQGNINRIPTYILLTFPASINNCHAHVWWTEFSEVGLYSGSGTIYDEDVKVALEKLDIQVERINENDIKEGKLKNYNIFIIPGGYTQTISENLKEKGFKEIRNFVKGGGKYIGICAGAYLAPDFGIIDVKNVRRSGIGLREIEILPRTRETLVRGKDPDHLLAKGYKGTIKIWYQNGPFIKPEKEVEVIAKYNEDFAAIVCSYYGKGKVVIFSPHPEGSLENKVDPRRIGTLNLLNNAINW